MGGARAVVYLLLLLGLLVPAYWGIFRTSSTTAQDANLVYCLDPAHQDGLVTAAVSLRPGGPWLESRLADGRRTRAQARRVAGRGQRRLHAGV